MFYYSILGIILEKTQTEYVSYSNIILLVLLTGGGLQRIQRGYKSHPRELPPIQKIWYIHVTPSVLRHKPTTKPSHEHHVYMLEHVRK